MARKLASIQKITNIRPIDGADKLELCNILGWQCIVEKGKYKENDLVFYFEVDSWLPEKPEYEFLRKNCWKENENGKGFRIRTIRLRKQISQGLVMPITNEQIGLVIERDTEKISDVMIGTDVTELLNVKLYNPPIPACLKGTIKGSFPSFIPKTDETRVQLLQDVITRHKGKVCYTTEKVDGSSLTCYLNKCPTCDGTGTRTDGINGEYVDSDCENCNKTGKVFGVCSRNLELIEGDDAYWKTIRELDIENKLRKNFCENVALQGELCGVGIQGNPLQLQEKTIFWFNVFNIDRYKYYNFEEFLQICKDMEIKNVPLIETICDWHLIDDIPELVKFATRKSELNPKVWAEGIVIRPIIEEVELQLAQDFGNGRLSFKVINPEYLLSENE